MNETRQQGFRFDTGPSLLTMPVRHRRTFRHSRVSTRGVLTLAPIQPMCRYFFADGSRLDADSDATKMEQAVAQLSRLIVDSSIASWPTAAPSYEATAEVFLFTPIHE
jgi:phytoene desaturase